MNETILIALITALTSSGVCSVILYMIQRRDQQKDKGNETAKAQSDMLMGLGHDRIVYLGASYLQRDYITQDEYENLHDYLYKPYTALGGNGTAKKIMAEVEKLPLRKEGGKDHAEN